MTIQLSQQDLDLEMRRYLTEFRGGFRESTYEWSLGSWSLSKAHKNWRIGWSHTLGDRARWTVYPFHWRGENLVGMVFDSG